MRPSLPPDSPDFKSVAIIGEYTSPSGPYFDDHFLVAVFPSGVMQQWTAGDSFLLIPLLQNATGASITFQLSHTTDSASRVIFPPLLAEHPLFDFDPDLNKKREKGITGVLKRIREHARLTVDARLTAECQEYLKTLGK